MNAMFMMQFFGKEANDTLPKDIKHVVSNLEKNNVVFCGALRFEDNATSDSNAAKIASHLKTEFINLTNVKGLYSKDPKAYKDAKFISEISWKDFEKIALSLDYKAGQHFVLDQSAATSIKKGKIKTFILGSDLKNFEKFLRGKSFVGTTICE
jgi:uridylate kinase